MKSDRELEEERILNATSPFEILNISQQASIDEIKKAYRKLALKYHTDRNIGGDFERFSKITQKITEAKDALIPNEQTFEDTGAGMKRNPAANASNARTFNPQPSEKSLRLDLKSRIETLETYLHCWIDASPKPGLFSSSASVTSKLNSILDDISNELEDSATSAFTRGTFGKLESTTSFYQDIKSRIEDLLKNENIDEDHENYKCLKHCMNIMDKNHHAESLGEKTEFVNNLPDRIIEFSNKRLVGKGLPEIDKRIFDHEKTCIDANDNRLNSMYPPANFADSFRALPKGIQEMINYNRSWQVSYQSKDEGRVIFTFDKIENFLNSKTNEPTVFGINLFSPHRSSETDSFYHGMLNDMQKISAPKAEEKRYSR